MYTQYTESIAQENNRLKHHINIHIVPLHTIGCYGNVMNYYQHISLALFSTQCEDVCIVQ